MNNTTPRLPVQTNPAHDEDCARALRIAFGAYLVECQREREMVAKWSARLALASRIALGFTVGALAGIGALHLLGVCC